MLWIINKFLWWIIGVQCWTFMQTEQGLLLTSACLGRCWLACGFYLWWKQSMDACWLLAFASITYANVGRVSPCVFSLHAFVEIVHGFVCTPSLTLSVCLCLRCGTLKHTQTYTHTHTHTHTSQSANTPTPSLRLYALCSWHCLCFSLLVAPKLSPPDRQPQRGGNGRTRPAAPTAAWAPPRARNAARPPTSASPVRYL